MSSKTEVKHTPVFVRGRAWLFISDHRLRWEACVGLFYACWREILDSVGRVGADELARGAEVDSSFHPESLRLVEGEWVIAFGEKRIE